VSSRLLIVLVAFGHSPMYHGDRTRKEFGPIHDKRPSHENSSVGGVRFGNDAHYLFCKEGKSRVAPGPH
jgi:hypothetical protein